MKILFVSSGNRGLTPIIHNQGESLKVQGNDVEYFLIKGKGVLGYLSNIQRLKKYLNENHFDVIHAHYSLTAFVVSMAQAKPLVVSLMGSDVKKGWIYRIIIKFFAIFFSWKTIIVKSEDMKKSLKIDKAMVIPNGVDMQRFIEKDRVECRKKLGWNEKKKHILFPADITRPEKNFSFLEKTVTELQYNNIEIHWFNNLPNEETPFWYNASDLVVMTSLWEGSPNAIKEAMCCNCKIVSTNVGNVQWLFGDTSGCYITDFTTSDCANKIRNALSYNGKINGRQRIINLGLSNDLVAKRLIKIYETVL